MFQLFESVISFLLVVYFRPLSAREWSEGDTDKQKSTNLNIIMPLTMALYRIASSHHARFGLSLEQTKTQLFNNNIICQKKQAAMTGGVKNIELLE